MGFMKALGMGERISAIAGAAGGIAKALGPAFKKKKTTTTPKAPTAQAAGGAPSAPEPAAVQSSGLARPGVAARIGRGFLGY